jgi:hypothetical protein
MSRGRFGAQKDKNSSARSFFPPLHAWKKSYKGFLAIAKTQYNSKG